MPLRCPICGISIRSNSINSSSNDEYSHNSTMSAMNGCEREVDHHH